MRRNTVARDRNQLDVNLVLVFLTVALELIEHDQHDSLLWGEVAPKTFREYTVLRYEGDHDREGLRSERQMLEWLEYNVSDVQSSMAILRIAFQSSPRAVGIQEEISVWFFFFCLGHPFLSWFTI
jgi:hypothetical protein